VGNDYGRVVCVVCKRDVPKRAPKQLICKRRGCKNARKRVIEQARRDYRRKYLPRPCQMCEKPLPKGKVRYHPKCRAQKERERLRIYYLKRKGRAGRG
jgi:hypothetical protein